VAPPEAPVFIVGSPRSGTTALFDLLARAAGVTSLGGESHLLWEAFHREGSRGWRSHALSAADVARGEPRAMYWAISRLGSGRYLDKSPRNSLRIEYLNALFPDAQFVFLRRDGRAAVSSLITGWRSRDRRFPELALPVPVSIEGHEGQGWRFVVPPGWQDYAAGKTLAEVSAFQWVASTSAILEARERIEPARWVDVAYEDLVASPVTEAAQIFGAVGLELDEGALEHAAELATRASKVTVTEPRQGKWREENPVEVQSVLHLIGPTLKRLGYSAADE
jgi:LPS sulfotransferase NodH